mgnify:CR=1 FL=1
MLMNYFCFVDEMGMVGLEVGSIESTCDISLCITNMALILATVINYQVISLSTTISILHKMLSCKLMPSHSGAKHNGLNTDYAPTVDEEYLAATRENGQRKDGVLLQSPTELLLFIQVLTGNCVALIKSLGCRIVYILANSPTFCTANQALSESLDAWALELLHRQHEAAVFDGAVSSSGSSRHRFDFAGEEDLASSSSASQTPLQRAKPYFFKDRDDEVIGFIQGNQSFLKAYSEEYDNKLDYKTQVEQAMYNEREKVSDSFVELIRQYHEISRSDVSGYKMKEFLSQLKGQASQKILSIHDLSLPWLADLFVKLLLFHGVNVFSSSPTLLSSTATSFSFSSPGTGDNTPSRSTPVQFGSATTVSRSNSISVEVNTALSLTSSVGDIGPSTPPRGQGASVASMLIKDQIGISVSTGVESPSGVLNGASPSSAQTMQVHTHPLHSYDKQKMLEERMGGKADGGFSSSTLFPAGISSLGAVSGSEATSKQQEPAALTVKPGNKTNKLVATSKKTYTSGGGTGALANKTGDKMAAAMTARPASTSTGNNSQAYKKALQRVKPEKLNSFSNSSASTTNNGNGNGNGASSAFVGNSSSFQSVSGGTSVKKDEDVRGAGGTAASSVWAVHETSNKTSASGQGAWGKGSNRVVGKIGSAGAAAGSASGSVGGKGGSKAKSGAAPGSLADVYERPVADLFGGNLMFFFRFIVLTDSFKFGKSLEYAITTELVTLMSAVVEQLESSMEARGDMSMDSGSLDLHVNSSLLSVDGEVAPSPRADADGFASERTGDSNIFSSETAFRDINIIPSAHRGKKSRLPISVQLMKMKVLGKFLGLLHFYPQWTLLPGHQSGGPRSGGDISSSSPIMRMSREFLSQRKLFYQIKLARGRHSDDRSGTDSEACHSSKAPTADSDTRPARAGSGISRSDSVPVFQWLVRARARRQLIMVVPWIIEFLKCSKYVTALYDRQSSGSAGSTSMSAAAGNMTANQTMNAYEDVIMELLSIESELISLHHGADAVSTTRTYLMLLIQELYSICPYQYMLGLRKRVAEQQQQQQREMVQAAKTKASEGGETITMGIDGFPGSNLLGLSGFVRHVTPQLYDFVHSLQRQIASQNSSSVVAAPVVDFAQSSSESSVTINDAVTVSAEVVTSTTPTTKRQIVPTAVPAGVSTSNEASGTRSSVTISSGLLSPISHQFISSFNNEMKTASGGKGSRALSANTVTAVLSDSKSDRSPAVLVRTDNEAVTNRLQAGFWNQHPALDHLRGFVIDHLLQLGLKHMKEHVAHGVRVLWAKCAELKLKAGASATASSAHPSPVVDNIQSAQVQLYASPAYQLQQSQFQSYSDKLSQLATGVKRQVISDTNTGFLDKFIEVDGMGAIASLCGMYDPQAPGRPELPQLQQSNEKRVTALAVKLIGAELRTQVRGQLTSFLSSYLNKKLSEVTQLALSQFKKAHKLEGTSRSSAVTSQVREDSTAAVGTTSSEPKVFLGEPSKSILLETLISEVNTISSRIMGGFSVENVEATELQSGVDGTPLLWRVRLGGNHDRVVLYNPKSQSSLVASHNQFSRMCNDFELVFQKVAKSWAMFIHSEEETSAAPMLKNWCILLANLRLLCTCWVHGVLQCSQDPMGSSTHAVDIFKMMNVLLPTWVYLDSAAVRYSWTQVDDVCLNQGESNATFVSDLLIDCKFIDCGQEATISNDVSALSMAKQNVSRPLISATHLVRLYTIACKPQTISFHQNCLGLNFPGRDRDPDANAVDQTATQDDNVKLPIPVCEPRMLLLLHLVRHLHAAYLCNAGSFDIIDLFVKPTAKFISPGSLVALRQFVADHSDSISMVGDSNGKLPSDLVTLVTGVIVALLASRN